MSRNVDKANSKLVLYQELEAGKGGYMEYSRLKRPRVGSVKVLKEAREWRRQLVVEVKGKVTRLFDPSLNFLQVRDLNDEVNELLREKRNWDWHISKRLGGGSGGPGEEDSFGGKVVMGMRYFGRALELPEVVELLKKQVLEDEEKQANLNVVDRRLMPGDRGSVYYQGETHSVEFEESIDGLTRMLQSQSQSQSQVRSQDEQLTKLIRETEVPELKDVEQWLVQKRKQKLLEELDL